MPTAMQARNAVFGNVARVENLCSQVMKEILKKRSSTTEVNAQGCKTGTSCENSKSYNDRAENERHISIKKSSIASAGSLLENY